MPYISYRRIIQEPDVLTSRKLRAFCVTYHCITHVVVQHEVGVGG